MKVLKITQKTLDRLEADDPALSSALYKTLASTLAEQLISMAITPEEDVSH